MLSQRVSATTKCKIYLYSDFILGLVIGQHDNDQILGVTHEQKAYNKQHLTIINANAHIICDESDNFQYLPSSYPGHHVYRDLTSEEVEIQLPEVLTKYKNCFRNTRQLSMEAAIEHLSAEGSHRPLTELLTSMRSELKGKKICDRCKTTTSVGFARKCVTCGGSLSVISEEIIFDHFLQEVENSGKTINSRYYPGTGFKTEDRPDFGRVVPGDPDMLPPTTRENIAALMNTAGYRL